LQVKASVNQFKSKVLIVRIAYGIESEIFGKARENGKKVELKNGMLLLM
jgi:hypothetical protein